jgi:hypothetical protein
VTFDDLPLFDAIYDLRAEMEAACENPGSDSWTTEEDKRHMLAKRLLAKLMINVDQRLIDAWIRFRKSGTVNGRKKSELIVEVARTHGGYCFYRNRDLGDCSLDIDLERLIPETRGGIYTIENCVIACCRHNRMRGDQDLESFLSSRKDHTT